MNKPGTPSFPAKIVLVAGPVKVPDRRGHHDYLAGCTLLAELLGQSPGVRAVVVHDGWPADEAVFDDAHALVFYAGGRHKHPLAEAPRRPERMQALIEQGVGVVMLHQAVSFSPELGARALGWIGGVHLLGKTGRGHWPTRHRAFPTHPATHGVTPWKVRDGWIREIRFAEGCEGITPLLWSSKAHGGSPDGGLRDVVCWAYERPAGGRAFCFTGLDGHAAWAIPGLRQLVVNGVLWAAGSTVPADGAPCALQKATLNAHLTPRGSPAARALSLVRKIYKPRKTGTG